MKTAVLLVVMTWAVASSLNVTLEEPWEPVPARKAVEPRAARKTGEPGTLGSFIDLSMEAYRFFLSDQQGEICSFHPSCSEYAQQALDSCGAVLGLLMISDRLSRCNWTTWSCAPRYYKIEYVNGRAVLRDPVNARPTSKEGDR